MAQTADEVICDFGRKKAAQMADTFRRKGNLRLNDREILQLKRYGRQI